MTAAHLHLLLNHVPILGTFFALVLLARGAWRGSTEVLRLAWTAFALLALVTVPVFKSGDPAADVVAKRPEVSQPLIDEHEESAKYALLAMAVLGAVSLAGLWLTRRAQPAPAWLRGVSLLVAALVFTIMARTGYLGGQIRHAELRPGAGPGSGEPAEADR